MISIFAKSPYLLDGPQGNVYLQRVSSRVRAEEIAEYLGAKLNPKDGYENDVCIYVKPPGLDRVKDGDYVDVLDDRYQVMWLKTRPGVKAIAMTELHYQFLKKELPNHEIVLIPHHHINFERAVRTRKEILTCGYLGADLSRRVHRGKDLAERLKEIGLEFKPLLSYTTRQDIIDYYKTIDIQVIGYFDYADNVYRTPMKIINAMSFGIPTVAGRIEGFKDVEGFYTPVKDLDELVVEAQKLKDGWDAEKLINEAEKYHIINIAKLYQKL